MTASSVKEERKGNMKYLSIRRLFQAEIQRDLAENKNRFGGAVSYGAKNHIHRNPSRVLLDPTPLSGNDERISLCPLRLSHQFDLPTMETYLSMHPVALSAWSSSWRSCSPVSQMSINEFSGKD